MPGDALYADVWTVHYIRSEAAFNRARLRGYWQVVKRRIAGQNPYLLAFHQVVPQTGHKQAVHRRLRDIPLTQIVGSLGRNREFTYHFLPLTHSERQKERWRASYTQSLTGLAYPPIEVLQLHQVYFVVNGHHRVSVACYLGWETIQARVTELQLPDPVVVTSGCTSP